MPECPPKAKCQDSNRTRGAATSPDDVDDGDIEAGLGTDAHSLAASSPRQSRSQRRDENDDNLARLSTHISLGADNPVQHTDTRQVRRRRAGSSSSLESAGTEFEEIDDSVYDRIAPHRKVIVVILLSFCSFLAPVSSTSVLAATPEVAAEYNTTGAVVNIANAVYMLMMGVSPIVWGPLSQVYGRRLISQLAAVLFFGCSIGTALAPNLAAFFIFRSMTAFEGTAFILVGSACLSDIYRPTERATAMGWFLSGTLIGPAFGPFLGGIIVTYTSWRVIFWLQTGLSGAAAIGTFLILPETIHHRKIDDLANYSARHKARVLWEMINPIRVLKLYRYPNLVLVAASTSSIIWNMYSLLTPIRYVLNPRFNLVTPMQGGLFYLAPGCGYIVGTFGGGRYADYVVRQWIAKRDGVRIPEDRMRSALPFMGIVIPACMLIYGWSVEKEVGGVPLPVIMMFLQGVAQLFCFPSLNTYCLDVMQGRGAEVIAGNYFVRYLFACAAMACVLPATEAMGVGWFSTVSAALLLGGAACTLVAIKWGKGMRDRVDEKRRAKREGRREARNEAHGVSRPDGSHPTGEETGAERQGDGEDGGEKKNGGGELTPTIGDAGTNESEKGAGRSA